MIRSNQNVSTLGKLVRKFIFGCTIISLIFILDLKDLKAQVAVTASGGNASGGGGNVSYTVGQIVNSFNSGISGSEAQGVQQPFEISVTTGFENVKGIDLAVSAYPNPATDRLILKIEGFDISSMDYQLFDFSGRLLESKKISSSETTIITARYVPSTYFLKVLKGNNEIKNFKIIKN